MKRRIFSSMLFLGLTLLAVGAPVSADPPPSRSDVVRALSGFEHVPPADAIRAWGEPGILTLMELARDPATARHVRVRAVYALRLFPSHTGVAALLRAVADERTAHAMIRRAAIDAIAEGFGSVSEVARHLADTDPDVRDGAAWALVRLDTNEARDAIRAALRTETHDAVRVTLQRGLRPRER